MMESFTEHRPASSFRDDAGLWTMLLEKAKKGTTTEPYFAANIVGGSLPTSMFAKLCLPAAFLEHHRQELTEKIILEGPDGHKWPVLLGMSLDTKPCLLHGWVQFATDFNLAVNDQIVFFLYEDSHFLVQVFDSHHNIKRRGGGTCAETLAATAELPQVTTDPVIQSFSFQTPTPTPNISSHPASTSNDRSVAKKVHTVHHTTGQASPSGGPSGVKLGNREPGVEEEDDDDQVVTHFNANPAEIVESFQSAPASDAEEDNWMLRMERAMKNGLNRKPTTCHGEGELRNLSAFDPEPQGTLTLYDNLETANSSVEGWSSIGGARLRGRKWKEPKQFIEEKIPEKRARQAPTDRSNIVPLSSSRRRLAARSASPPWNRLKAHRTRETTLAAAMAARALFSADTAEAREATSKEGEATASVPALAVPASDPVTPLPVEAPVPKQAFKRPQPRNAPRQLFYSKRRPVTQQEREAALEEGQDYAAACYNRTYVMQLRFEQVYCTKNLTGSHIVAPTPDFAAAMELPLQGHQPVTLYNRMGRQWYVVWLGEHPLPSGFARAGWTEFVLGHCLEEGDVCVFELPDLKASNIHVTVYPVVPLNPFPRNWINHYSLDGPVLVPGAVPAEEQPEGADCGLDLSTILPGQSSPSFEKEDSGVEEKRRRLSNDHKLAWKEEITNKSCEENKGSEQD